MKKFFIAAIFTFTAFTSFSQSLSYQDLAILFSQDDKNGTARFTAMSGAFGALGGDISSMNVNPAGLSVFNNSSFSGTLNSRNTEIKSNYYGANLINQNQFTNLSQAGAVLVFDSAYKSDWSKFAVGINYRITKDFNNSFLAQGNSGVATFTEYPLDTNNPALVYGIADEQRFNNTFAGELSEVNFGFSSVYDQKLHVGLGLNFYDLNFNQQSTLTEFNSDVNGNELDVNLYQDNFTTGTGFSANLGFIYRANQSFRFGLSYQTPTWFSEIIQDVNYAFDRDNFIDNTFGNGDVDYFIENDEYFESLGFEISNYRLRTPSKLTASTAFIFGKNGLLSLDYTNKNYKGITLSEDNFSAQNQAFQNDFRNTHNLNIGTEWRLDKFSVRGGYSYEQTPFENNNFNPGSALQLDDVTGYSFGAGYNFGNFKVDFAYSNSNRTGAYNFYSGFNVDATNLTLDNRFFTGTVSISL